MMGARPSFAPFYLRGPFKDYSHPDAKLAGRKRYLPRYPRERLADARAEIVNRLEKQERALHASSGRGDLNEDVITRLAFLIPKNGPELRFKNRIRLFNVTAAEIGLVLWVLTHGGPRHDPEQRLRHMIGRGKPFGAGQMRIETARLAVERNDGRKPLDKNAEHIPFLDAFEQHAKSQIGEMAWRTVIDEYLKSCDPAVGAALQNKAKLDYLPLRQEVGSRTINPYQLLRGMTKPRKDGTAPRGKNRLLEFE